MAVEPLKFNQVTSVKLPRSAAYIHDNLVQYNDAINNISYYAIINGFEAWIIKHSDPEKLTNNDKKEPTVQLRKVPYDKLDSVSCVKWCKFNSTMTFVMGTQSGIIHVYDFEAKKILYSHDVTTIQTTPMSPNKAKINNHFNPTINCVHSNDKNLLFVGLSSGALLSFTVDDKGLSNKKLIFQCANNEAINCMSRPIVTNTNMNKNNKIYIGCDDGSVVQYDFYTADLDVIIDKSINNKIFEEKKINSPDLNDQDYTIEPQFASADAPYANNCGPVICIASCDDFIVAGYASGHIKIVQKSELSLVIKQIAMHRRMVTSVAILENIGLIATVSEDGYYHILRNEASNLEVIRSGCFENGILIGVEFIKSQHYSIYNQKHKDRMIIITAYDRNRVAFV